MKTRHVGMVLVLALVLAATPVLAASGLTKAEAAQATTEVESTLTNLLAAADARDSAAMGLYFDKDASFVDSSGITRGWDAYKANLDAQFAFLADDQVPAHEGVAIFTNMLDENNAVSMYSFTMRTKEGDLFGVGTAVLQRGSNGDWSIVHVQSGARKASPGEVLPSVANLVAK